MVVGILLAAGSSQRMGRDKLDLPWRGSTVLESTLERWSGVDALHHLLLVRRPGSRAVTRPGVTVLENRDADEGMGSSLRLAARNLPAETEAVVVGLADMPEVSPQTIDALVHAWRPLGPDAIVAPLFEVHRGHPVLLGADFVPALRDLSGDQGARSILKRHADRLHLVSVDDPGVLLDIDTPADLERRP